MKHKKFFVHMFDENGNSIFYRTSSSKMALTNAFWYFYHRDERRCEEAYFDGRVITNVPAVYFVVDHFCPKFSDLF